MPDRMTSLPQPFQGVADKSARAATPSGLSRLASSSAKLASTNAGMVPNETSDEGRELGRHLSRFCDERAEESGRDGRCDTCAFRAGDHLANGSAATLMTALKCAAEREPFWCHEHDRPCAGWQLMRFNEAVAVPWDYIAGADE